MRRSNLMRLLELCEEQHLSDLEVRNLYAEVVARVSGEVPAETWDEILAESSAHVTRSQRLSVDHEPA